MCVERFGPAGDDAISRKCRRAAGSFSELSNSVPSISVPRYFTMQVSLGFETPAAIGQNFILQAAGKTLTPGWICWPRGKLHLLLVFDPDQGMALC